MAAALRARFASAMAEGALAPIATELHLVEDRGVHFAVRRATGAQRKPATSATDRADPFLPPYDAALFVDDLGPEHVCLLNRFPVLREHALVVTRTFAEQEALPTARDWAAVWSLLGDAGGLAFYNAGAGAGASQRHRHFQHVPTPLAPGDLETPMDALLAHARFDAALGRVPGLPFLHGMARLRSLQRMAAIDAAGTLHALVGEMARAFACDRRGHPWNLLLTRDWLLFVPRSRERFEGISLNALAFAGALLVRSPESLARLRTAGPMEALRHTGVSPGDPAPTRMR